MAVDWGDVPTWVASVVVSVSLAGNTLVNVYRGRRAQASQVVVYAEPRRVHPAGAEGRELDTGYPGSVEGVDGFRVFLDNQSSAPVTFPVLYGAVTVDRGLVRADGMLAMGPKGQHFVPAKTAVHVDTWAGLDEIEVRFTDSNLRRWRIPLMGNLRPARVWRIEGAGVLWSKTLRLRG